MSKLKRYRSIAILLAGMLLVLPGILVLLQAWIEPNYEFRLGDLISGNTRLRFRDRDLSAVPKLLPVQQLIGDGHVCDAMIVNGSYDRYIAAVVQTPDGCRLLKDNLIAKQIDTLESDGEHDFGLDSQCSRHVSDSARVFVGQIRMNEQEYGVKGRFYEQSGWVFVLMRPR